MQSNREPTWQNAADTKHYVPSKATRDIQETKIFLEFQPLNSTSKTVAQAPWYKGHRPLVNSSLVSVSFPDCFTIKSWFLLLAFQ